METEKLNYHLPAELIAQRPLENRENSRMLILNRSADTLQDSKFSQISAFLRKGDCIAINNTKVIPARFLAKRKTGAEIEGLFIAEQENKWKVMLTKSSRIKVGESIDLLDRNNKQYCSAAVDTKLTDGQWLIRPDCPLAAEKILDNIGFAPLPPYIRRDTDLRQAARDRQRYQTVYARNLGAVAAPTAGLHFTKKLIETLKTRGVEFAYVTLAVGEGTFKPVTAETLEEHRIHEERFSIDERNASVINKTRKKGGRIIAVGTTSVRVLETAAAQGQLSAMTDSTRLFIRPGYKFRMVDGMVTNFHLPKSTLLALVGAFAGLDTTLAAYQYAIEKRYRFYSYGDAVLII